MIKGTGLLPMQVQPCHGTRSQIVKEITNQDESQSEGKKIGQDPSEKNQLQRRISSQSHG